MVVFVLNNHGDALMPCKEAKARHLLRDKKAKVVCRSPFTIQLLYWSGNCKQDINLGVDPGYSTVGFSAVSKKQELLSGELELRKNVSKLIGDKAMYRRNKRSKLWYRKPRFLNRSIPKGWLAPSIQHKLDTHIRLIDKIVSILPITKIIVEIAKFDQQKLQNPEIKGIKYQQGKLFKYNVKAYLLEKFRYKCAYCNKSDIPLEVEHIIPKVRGGSNRISNLTIACHKCNQKKGSKTAKEFGYPNIQAQGKKSLRSTTFMNLVYSKLFQSLKEKYSNIKVNYTFGYRTKFHRIKQKLDKTHFNDAFVIAKGKFQIRSDPYELKQIRRNNRKLQTNRKGFKPSIRRQRYKLQPNDLVDCEINYVGELWKVKGIHNYGNRAIIVNKIGELISENIKYMELIKYGKGISW